MLECFISKLPLTYVGWPLDIKHGTFYPAKVVRIKIPWKMEKMTSLSYAAVNVFSGYSRVFQAAYLFVSFYVLLVFVLFGYYLATEPPTIHNDYAQLVAERLLSGRIIVLPVFFTIFHLSFLKQKYFSEVVVFCAAWIGAGYIEDYFLLGSRFLTSHLWKAHVLLALRPVLLIALIWMAIEQRHSR